MNILITGGAGFIGSHLAGHLHAQGHQIQIVDNLSTGRLDNLSHLLGQPGIFFLQASVQQAEVLNPAMEACDFCFHLAAPVGVSYIMAQPLHTLLDSVHSVEVLLAAAHRYGKPVLLASSSEIYGRSLELLRDPPKSGLQETTPRVLGPTSEHRWAYAHAKSFAEFLGQAYWKEHQLPVTIVRFFNTVGPRQVPHYGMVLPNFIQRALRGEELLIHGTGNQCRSFLHVADAVEALARLMQNPAAAGDTFNLGSPEQISINALAERVRALTGSAVPLRHISYAEAYGATFEDVQQRSVDISHLEAVTGFRPQRGIEAILRDMIAWYRQTQPSLDRNP